MKKFTLLTLCILISSSFLFSQSKWKLRLGSSYLPNDTVLSIDTKGDTLMLGTVAGLVIKTPQQKTVLTTADGLASNRIEKIEIADNGSFMVYHDDISAITYYDGSNFQILNEGVAFVNPVRGLESDADNVFYYLGGPSIDCYTYSNSSFQSIDSSPFVSYYDVIVRGGDGAVYSYNISDSTLLEYRNGNLTAAHPMQEQVYQILGTDDGVLVQLTFTGQELYLYNADGFTQLNPNNEFYNNGKLLYFDSDSSIWASEKQTLHKLDKDESLTSLNLNSPIAPIQIKKWNNKFIIHTEVNGYLESYDDDLRFQKDKISSQNKMKFRLNPNGSLGYLRDETSWNRAQFDGKVLFFAANPWLAGNIQQSQHHRLAANRDNGWNSSSQDFLQRIKSGPYSGDYDVFKNHKVWKVTQAQINDHVANYSNGGYEMPLDIQTWPAHGAIGRGQTKCLAPFIDVDDDGIYKPENGDYPQIRGDEAVYAIFNDVYNRMAGEQPMGVEGHVMMYSYASSDPELKNSVFLNYRIINRSVNNYEDFKFGFNIDGDLGNPMDDYTGCDTNNNFFYFYNGDDFDDDLVINFDSLTPALGIGFLKNNMSSFISYNSGAGLNGSPSVASDYYNYLNGKYRNGQYPQDSQGQLSSFMYPGDPVTNTGWTEGGQGNQPGDRRGVGATSIPQFNSGDTVEIDMVLTLAENDGTVDNFEVVGDLRTQVQDIQQWYNNQQFDPWKYDCIAYNSVPDRDLTKNSSFKLYPNPAKNRINLEFSEELSEPALIEIYNAVGTLVRSEYRTGKKVQVQLSSLNSGYYLIRVNTGSKMDTKPLIIR